MGPGRPELPDGNRIDSVDASSSSARQHLPSLGFLVNPIAGMGGAVGLKGTDGPGTVEEAIKRGAKPTSPVRAGQFFNHLKMLGTKVELKVAPGSMGEDIAKLTHPSYTVVGLIHPPTSSLDTVRIAGMMAEAKVDLLVFCGGDGTAYDIMKSVTNESPVLGVPAGVKVYSSVFAVSPHAAAETVAQFLNHRTATRKGEVLDIDEDDYRANKLSVKLAGYLVTPEAGTLIQSSKSPSLADEELEMEAIARYVKEEANPATIYVLGPGTTVYRIAQEFGVKKTLLGVDVVKGDGTILGVDVSESELLRLVDNRSKIIVSPIGGQGFLFGRGNQQISPRVLRKVGLQNLIIVAAAAKIVSLRERRLIVDTGDEELDAQLRGYCRVLTSYREEMVVKVE